MTGRVLSAVGCGLAAVLALASCSSSRDAAQPTPPSTAGNPANANDTVSLRGTARLDGKPFDAQFLGAVVTDSALATPCNVTIPAIVAGQFAIDVYGHASLLGCGRAGTQILLWTYVGPGKVYAAHAIPWPEEGAATGLAVDFSAARPMGAAPTLFELNGPVSHADGTPARAGAKVEAFIGTTLCGVASVRTGVFDGYILHVVGPDAVPGCARGAPITFKVDGVPAPQTVANGGAAPRSFALTVP